MGLSSGKSRFRGILQPYQWSFVGYLILAALIPKFYELSNTFWIGHISYEALAITEQYEFLAVTLEIVNETIPFGVLALVAQNFRDREKVISIIKSGLVVQVLFSGLLMSVVVFFTSQFVSSIGTPPEIVSLTSNYLILKSVALPFEAVAALLLIAVKSMRRGRDVLYLVLFSVVLNMVLDLFLISNMGFSLNLGVQGVAIGYVISKVSLFAVTSVFVGWIMGVKLRSLSSSFANVKGMLRPLFSIGGWTGLDSLVRNIGYILVPLNVLNLIGANQFGGYGLAMTVMWTVIIPVLAITEGTNVVVGNYYGERRYKDLKKVVVTSLLLVSVVMAAIFLGGALFWRSLSYFFNENPVIVDYSVTSFWWLIIPYCLFGLSMVLRSIFYGTGKTKNIFVVSGVLNFGLIFPFWVLSKLNFLTVSFENVMTLFVVVFAVDLLVTYLLARRAMSKIKQ